MGHAPKAIAVINLDKPREIRLNMNAMDLFEAKTGKNLLNPKTMTNPTCTDIHVLLWATLHVKDPNLTYEEAGELIDASNLDYVTDVLMGMYQGALPGGKEGETSADPLPESSPTSGQTFGVLEDTTSDSLKMNIGT